jgi:hypothetical protein
MNWSQAYTRLSFFYHGWTDERYTCAQEFPLGLKQWLQHLQCNLNIKTKLNVKCFQQKEILNYEYCRGLHVSYVHVLECTFHVGYKLVVANVSMTHKFWGKQLLCVGIESHAWCFHKLKLSHAIIWHGHMYHNKGTSTLRTRKQSKSQYFWWTGSTWYNSFRLPFFIIYIQLM